MIKYEIRKLLRRPIFLFMLLISLGIQIVCALSWLDEIRPESAYRQLLQEYAACSLDEAVEKITLESASAEDSYFRNYEAEYEAGEITIDEYRAYQQAFPQRAAYYSATQGLLSQVEQLAAVKENLEKSDVDGSNIRVIDETGWILADKLRNIWWCPLVLAFLFVAIFCEWHDVGMYDLILTTAKGKRRTWLSKLCVFTVIALVVSVIDALTVYLIPQWIYGLGGADAAIQSVAPYGNRGYALTLKAYAVLTSLARIAGDALAGLAWVLIAQYVKRSYQSIGVMLLIVIMAAMLLFAA